MLEQISRDIFRPRVFSTNPCPKFLAFLEPEIQSVIEQSLSTPAHQHITYIITCMPLLLGSTIKHPLSQALPLAESAWEIG